MMFIGRNLELGKLRELFEKDSASFVVCRGRRRIGKSTLIQQFGKHAGSFMELQGLSPREGLGRRGQLEAFSEQLAQQTSLPKLKLESWSQAFDLLDSCIASERTIVLLDEISWMGVGDRDFAGTLKIAWDTKLKKHKRLILVVCGSVSSWIDYNILRNAGFIGRVSLDLKLRELPLEHCHKFWKRQADRISTIEKIKLLAVTGGVPRYLEEINPRASAEANIKRMCFSREGLLFAEYDRIFFDMFSRRADTYRKIIEVLARGKNSVQDICREMGVERSGTISEYLDDLMDSGLVAKDTSYAPGMSRPGRLARYRLCDNYMRFYLKYIEPNKDRIEQGLYQSTPMENILNWDVIMGFQFENLLLNNLASIFQKLQISPSIIQSASPFFQRRTARKKGCQVDLLIQTRHTLYICEMKFRKQIGPEIIQEVKDKVGRLAASHAFTIRPVLLYAGELSPGVIEEGYFDHCLDVACLFKGG